jgi:DNA replication protein DnaC
MTTITADAPLAMLLRTLKLPTVARHADEIAALAERDGWTFGHYLRHLIVLELEERKRRRIERNQRDSELPGEKTLATLDRKRLPAPVAKLLPTLCEGTFLDRGDNLLAVRAARPRQDACRLRHRPRAGRRGRRVLFTPTYALVQRLLAAKRDLRLEKELDDPRRLRRRHPRRHRLRPAEPRRDGGALHLPLPSATSAAACIITSNLVFSEWDRIFKDPMTTAAAIDRLVHHATILEMTGRPQKSEETRRRQLRPRPRHR